MTTQKNKKKKEELVTIEGEYPVSCAAYVKSTAEMASKTTLARVRKDLKEQLPNSARLQKFWYKETDSGNLSHACAYFGVKITALNTQLLTIIGPNKLIVPNNLEKATKPEKKAADVAPGAKKTTGVGISSHPNKDNGKHTRAELMAQAQAKGIKYFRILHHKELDEVLRLQKMNTDISNASISAIQDKAKKRWKAGWTSNKPGAKK